MGERKREERGNVEREVGKKIWGRGERRMGQSNPFHNLPFITRSKCHSSETVNKTPTFVQKWKEEGKRDEVRQGGYRKGR